MARGRPTRPRLRSKTATRRPPRARRFAVINPIGPAPTIATSYSSTNSAPTLGFLRHFAFPPNPQQRSAAKFILRSYVKSTRKSIRKICRLRREAKLAKIDLRRRAEIGRQRRAKSRAQIVEAARFLFTSRPIASVTIEDVTRQAQVAKGTFYSHFRSLDDLRAAVAVELSQTFEDLIDQSGLYAADPVARIAAGCAVFIGEAQRDPAWGALIARGACAFPTFASAARECLKTNLRARPKRRACGLLLD